MTDFTEAALKRCLNHLGVTDLEVESDARSQNRLRQRKQCSHPRPGCSIGAAAPAIVSMPGRLRAFCILSMNPRGIRKTITFDHAMVSCWRTPTVAMVERGDLIAMVAKPYTGDETE